LDWWVGDCGFCGLIAEKMGFDYVVMVIGLFAGMLRQRRCGYGFGKGGVVVFVKEGAVLIVGTVVKVW
jgi:hypothetical protein